MGRFLATIVMLTSSACCAMAQEPGLQSEKGKALTITMCAACHAVGATDSSPHSDAPPFRKLEKRLDLDLFVDRLERIPHIRSP